MNLMRPFAITAEVSTTTPGQAVWGDEMFPTTFNWGFSLQYSLPYYNSHVGEIGNDFLKHLIPTVEVRFSTATAHAGAGTWGTTGTIQPGVVYMADKWQVAVEAVIPINGSERSRRGVVASLDLFLDDIFPNTLGKPSSANPADVHRSPIMTRISMAAIAASLALYLRRDPRFRPRPAREGDASRRRHGRLGQRNPARVQRRRRAQILEGLADRPGRRACPSERRKRQPATRPC